MKSILCHVLLFAALAGVARAAELTSIGDWSEIITAANLVSGAGSDLQNQAESISGITVLTIEDAKGEWTLQVRRDSSQWDDNVVLSVKRTSEGKGGTISGGDTYIELTGSDSEFFSGSESCDGIALQFKLTGLSVNISPATYLSSIIFTIK